MTNFDWLSSDLSDEKPELVEKIVTKLVPYICESSKSDICELLSFNACIGCECYNSCPVEKSLDGICVYNEKEFTKKWLFAEHKNLS